jgi:CDP-glucose 4,6-dehydratase
VTDQLREQLGGRTVLVTGHTGFTGAWLTAWLADLGASVTGYSLAAAPDAAYSLARLDERCVSTIADINDREALRRALRHCQPDLVIHLAAQALVLEGVRNPVHTFDVNVMGTVHLLDAVRTEVPSASIVVVTTDKVYTPSVNAHREADPLGGHDPYSASKGAAELAVAAFAATYPSELRVATARAGNVIGGGDRARDRLVPDCVRAAERGETIHCRFPNAVRPWQHVLDAIRGYLTLGMSLIDDASFAGPWNFGPSPDGLMTVSALIGRFRAAWGSEPPDVAMTENNHPENPVLLLDPALARQRLGWQPVLSAAEAVDWTAQWYRAAHDGASPRALIEFEIARYVDRCSLEAARV